MGQEHAQPDKRPAATTGTAHGGGPTMPTPVLAPGTAFALDNLLGLQQSGGNRSAQRALDRRASKALPSPAAKVSADLAQPEGQHVKVGTQRVRIDGDGDQRKELEFVFDLVDSWDGTRHFGSAKTMDVVVTQLSSKKTQKVRLPIPKRGSRELLEPTVQVRGSDGHGPTRIALFESFRENVLEMLPGVRTPKATTYTLTFGGQSYTLTFPAERTPMKAVGVGGRRERHGDIQFLDITLGAFRDRFRLSFRQTGETATMGVHALRGGEAAGGRGVTLSMLKGPIDPKVVKSDPRTLAIDLNGDGKAEIFIYDLLTTPKRDPLTSSFDQDRRNALNQQRHHELRVLGPALDAEQTLGFTITARSAEQTRGDATDADKAAIRDYMDAGLFASQSHAGGAAVATIEVDAAAFGVLEQAQRDGYLTARVVAAATDVRQSLGEIRRATERAPLFADAVKRIDAYRAAFVDLLRSLVTQYPKYAEHRMMIPQSPPAADAVKAAIERGDWLAANRAFTGVLEELERVAREAQYFSGKSPGRVAMREKHDESQRYREKRDVLLEIPQDPATMGVDAKGSAPVRVPLVFHPDDKYKGAEGYQRAYPFEVYVWNDGTTWWLQNVTNPARANRFQVKGKAGETRPPRALFEQLDDKDRFPLGVFSYQWPGSGTTEHVTVRDRITFRDFTSWVIQWGLVALLASSGVGAVAARLALPRLTMVAGRAAAWSNEAVSVASTTKVGWELYDRGKKNELDAETMAISAATVYSSAVHWAAFAGKVRLSNAVEAARNGTPAAGEKALALREQNWYWIPLLKENERFADYTVIVLMLPLAWERIREIQTDKTLSAEEQEARANGLMSTLASLGAMIVVVWGKGTKPPVKSELRLVRHPNGTVTYETKGGPKGGSGGDGPGSGPGGGGPAPGPAPTPSPATREHEVLPAGPVGPQSAAKESKPVQAATGPSGTATPQSTAGTPTPRAPLTKLERDDGMNIVGGTSEVGKRLSDAEAEAVRRYEAGHNDFDKAALASARKRYVGQEKDADPRNWAKRTEQDRKGKYGKKDEKWRKLADKKERRKQKDEEAARRDAERANDPDLDLE